jgi:hypothetical protein
MKPTFLNHLFNLMFLAWLVFGAAINVVLVAGLYRGYPAQLTLWVIVEVGLTVFAYSLLGSAIAYVLVAPFYFAWKAQRKVEQS